MTELREQVYKTMRIYRDLLEPDNKGWKCLEVGIDGDEKPSGNYNTFGTGNKWATMDNVAYLKPDIVADICNTDLEAERFDLIILSQTIEHIYDFTKAILECGRLLKEGGHLIIDCPFMYPYHGTVDYGDYWRISPDGMRKQLQYAGLQIISCQLFGDILTSAIAKK
jgi:SAM-dependent methyltransferase